MNRSIAQHATAALVVAVLAAVGAAEPAQAQAGDRITIMVPDLAPQGGINDRFGERVADALREQIEELHTHQTVSSKDLRNARREYDLSREDLYDCIRARQLAMRMNWGLVLCGEYEETADGQLAVNAKFVGSANGEEFAVQPFTVGERQTDEAADRILETFDRWQTQLRHRVFCQDYMNSENWERALENCNTALEINPGTTEVLYQKAFILREMDQPQEALDVLTNLLEQDPIHQDALKLAGITATELDQPEQAQEYFARYMELNPGDVGVRLSIATEISNAGDPAQAMDFAEEGLEVEPDNMTLLTYIGHFAAQAAAQAESEAMQGGAVDPATVTEYFQHAADAYTRVFEARADSTEPQILERLTIAQFKLGQYDEAIQTATTAVEIDPENPALWDAYSRALQEAGQPQEALAALETAQELGRTGPAVVQRRAMLQLELGGAGEAVAALNQAVQDGDMEPTQAFNIIFSHAFNTEYKQGQLQSALSLMEEAGSLAQTERDQLMRNFWMGYILKERGEAALGDRESWNAARSQEAKPLFERALELLRASRGYEQYHPSAQINRQIESVEQYITITDTLIKRGR